MSITTGKFFSCILAGITPTSLGVALDALRPFEATNSFTAADWGDALTVSIAASPTSEVPEVVAEFQALLKANPEIFAALLETVLVTDGNGGFVPVPIAKILRDRIFKLGRGPGLLTFDWGAPPHPSGGDVSTLANLLSSFDEHQ
jgi:hypothetical protein